MGRSVQKIPDLVRGPTGLLYKSRDWLGIQGWPTKPNKDLDLSALWVKRPWKF